MDGRCTKNPRKNHQISYKSARPPVIQVHSLKLTQSLKDRPSQKESRLPTSNHQFSAQKSRPTVHWWKQEWTVRRPNTKIPRCQPFNKKETIHFRGGHHIHSLAAMEEESQKLQKHCDLQILKIVIFWAAQNFQKACYLPWAVVFL